MSTTSTYSVADTWISAHATTTNYGTATTIIVGDVGGGDRGRLLFRFTLPADPGGGQVISKIELKIFQHASNGTAAITHNVYGPSTADSTGWVESQTTWNIAATSNNWTVAGAASDFNTTVIESFVSTSTNENNTYFTIEIQGAGADNPLSLDWGDTINLMVRAPSGAGDNRYYRSKEYTGTDTDPYLLITHDDPASGFIPTPLMHLIQMV